jgi:hypothetical protein
MTNEQIAQVIRDDPQFGRAVQGLSEKITDVLVAEKVTLYSVPAMFFATLGCAAAQLVAIYQFGDGSTVNQLVEAGRRAMVAEIERRRAEAN